MGLNVDKPKQNGSGSSNDGNTARRAFSNVELLSSILNFDFKILKHFYIILIIISSEYKIALAKFKGFCYQTFSMYIEKYFWYPMSPTSCAQNFSTWVPNYGYLHTSCCSSRRKCTRSEKQTLLKRQEITCKKM